MHIKRVLEIITIIFLTTREPNERLACTVYKFEIPQGIYLPGTKVLLGSVT